MLRIQRATRMGIVICARYYSMIWTEFLSSELSDVGTASSHYFFFAKCILEIGGDSV